MYGHAKGDEIIIQAAAYMKEVFVKARIYRIGGDEFVVIEQDVLESEFYSKYEMLLKRMKELEISVATGYIWKERCLNLSEILQEADQKMYEDKKRYYSIAQNDRRRR